MEINVKIGKLVPAFALVILMSWSHPSPSNAFIYDYKYTGSYFNDFYSPSPLQGIPYTTSNFVSIDILSSQILSAYGSQNLLSYVDSFVMMDGVRELSIAGEPGLTGTAILEVAEFDASGLPARWQAYLENAGGIYSSDGIYDVALDYGEQNYGDGPMGQVSGNPGVWEFLTLPDRADPVPEPSTIFLLAAGLGMVRFTQMKRKYQNL